MKIIIIIKLLEQKKREGTRKLGKNKNSGDKEDREENMVETYWAITFLSVFLFCQMECTTHLCIFIFQTINLR